MSILWSPLKNKKPKEIATDNFGHPVSRAALTTHKLEWLEPWGKLAELELKCSNRELVYVGNTNVIQST